MQIGPKPRWLCSMNKRCIFYTIARNEVLKMFLSITSFIWEKYPSRLVWLNCTLVAKQCVSSNSRCPWFGQTKILIKVKKLWSLVTISQIVCTYTIPHIKEQSDSTCLFYFSKCPCVSSDSYLTRTHDVCIYKFVHATMIRSLILIHILK